MFSIAGIDLLEQELLDHERTLLEILLQDKTTKKNIIWATDDYAELGKQYSFKKEILPELVTGEQDSLIQPRVEKALEHQTNRTRDKAEVFTPSWICNAQNNLVDEQYHFLRQADHRRDGAGVDGCDDADRVGKHGCVRLYADHLPGAVGRSAGRQAEGTLLRL